MTTSMTASPDDLAQLGVPAVSLALGLAAFCRAHPEAIG